MNDAGTPADTREAMMLATYRALCEHGYSDTTIQRIADRFDKSKSLLYYHYDTKEKLLADFLGYLLDELDDELGGSPGDDPEATLRSMIDRIVPAEPTDEELRFRKALLEIRSQAPYHQSYREQFVRSDAIIVTKMATSIERGVEQGTFRDVDPQRTASFVLSSLYGILERGVTLEDTRRIERDRAFLLDLVDAHVVGDVTS